MMAGVIAASFSAIAIPATAQDGAGPDPDAPAVELGDPFSYSYLEVLYKGLDFDAGDGDGIALSLQQELVGNFFVGIEGTFAQLTQEFTFPTFDVDGNNVTQGTATRTSDADYVRIEARLGRYFELQDNLHLAISGFAGGTATSTDIQEIESSEDAEAVYGGTAIARLRLSDPVEVFGGVTAEGSASDFDTDEGVGVVFGAVLGQDDGIQFVVGGEALDGVTRYSGGLRFSW